MNWLITAMSCKRSIQERQAQLKKFRRRGRNFCWISRLLTYLWSLAERMRERGVILLCCCFCFVVGIENRYYYFVVRDFWYWFRRWFLLLICFWFVMDGFCCCYCLFVFEEFWVFVFSKFFLSKNKEGLLCC